MLGMIRKIQIDVHHMYFEVMAPLLCHVDRIEGKIDKIIRESFVMTTTHSEEG
jgi:hypothetical protein